jgi:hypothetical protein
LFVAIKKKKCVLLQLLRVAKRNRLSRHSLSSISLTISTVHLSSFIKALFKSSDDMLFDCLFLMNSNASTELNSEFSFWAAAAPMTALANSISLFNIMGGGISDNSGREDIIFFIAMEKYMPSTGEREKNFFFSLFTFF